MPLAEDILVPYADTLASMPMATHCRGTLIVTSLDAMKRHGHYERYQAAVDPAQFDVIVSSASNMWLPIEVGIAHYRACDALALPTDEQLAIGAEVVQRLQKTFLGTLLRAASSGAGVSPLMGLQKFAAIFTRSFKGGGVQVVRLGPKDVRVEFVGLPVSGIRYFRVAYRGFIQAGCEFFARRVVAAELGAYVSDTTLAYRLAWA